MREFNIGDVVRAVDSIDKETGKITDKKCIIGGIRYTVNGKIFNDGGDGCITAEIELVNNGRRFNIGDKVKFDTFVKGTGIVKSVDNEGYFIETSDVSGYDIVYSSEMKVTKFEHMKLKAGDKLEFGKWKFEVADDELVITNVYPSDTMVLHKASNGWIINGEGSTIYDK